ncbi:hypothetical protein N9449_07335 [Oceanospirillaceae bacterium]|nr:hypothetical protein [Oceanospirillaceae bacterium]
MNIAQVEENVKNLLASFSEGCIEQDAFIYELLLAYGHRKQSVTRLRSSERNLSSKGNTPRHDEIIWKRHLYFKQVKGNALHAEIDQMRKEKLVATNKIRFVVVTNFDQLLAVDTKTSDSLDIQLDDLPKQFDFFLPWSGMEKAVYQGENPADVKAAEKMAKLFDLIKDDNFDESNKDDTEALHSLNVFLTRLLFCFFAEDTEIFTDNQFSHAIESHTKDDGSDLSNYLNRLFSVLNTADGDRGDLPDAPLPQYLASFPYVNGGLFSDDIPSPVFSAKSRRMMIECGSELDWSDINPDIFGSMIQAVVHPDQRGGMGMHYTSVTNIMKVIEPLFLNDLYEELERVESSSTKLQKLQQRLGGIKIFDPACGSGNFLIIAYKELRKLEMEVLKRLQELELEKTGQISQPFSVIKLSQFYGIELDDFAHEVAILSLWLAEHQMNVEFKSEFGECAPSLPLQHSGGIVTGNAARLDWNKVCPTRESEIVFVLGNPPYLGARMQSTDQKSDLKEVLGHINNFKNLDYISCWFYKASKYVDGLSAFAFVSTNSISQGEQVSILWPHLIDDQLEIDFAVSSFPWANNAKNKAAVICVIIGMSKIRREKKIYRGQLVEKAKNINAYLHNADNVYVNRRTRPISSLPLMPKGNMPYDGGNLLLDKEEKERLIAEDPRAEKFIKRVVGAKEFIQGIERYCLWIRDCEVGDAMQILEISERVGRTKSMRESSTDAAANRLALRPHQFRETNETRTTSLVVPSATSERREYIPIGFIDSNTIVTNLAFVIYNTEPYLFTLLSSAMHMAWVRIVSGRLKSDYRYSSALSYNTFPMHVISKENKIALGEVAMKILSAREASPNKTLAHLYDPEKMPKELKDAHAAADELVDSCYKKSGFNHEGDRVEFLIKMYEKMTGGQNA